MREYFRNLWSNNPKIRKIVGWILVLIGILSIITPFTPFGFLVIVGLEILGLRILLWDNIKDRFKK